MGFIDIINYGDGIFFVLRNDITSLLASLRVAFFVLSDPFPLSSPITASPPHSLCTELMHE